MRRTKVTSILVAAALAVALVGAAAEPLAAAPDAPDAPTAAGGDSGGTTGSVTPLEPGAGICCDGVRFSDDGRYVTYTARRPDGPGALWDVFQFDRTTRVTTSITAGNSTSSIRSVTPDGRFVLFRSDATDLIPGTTDGGAEAAYLWDRTTGTTTAISRGHQPPNAPFDETLGLTPDGRYVVFATNEPGRVPEVTSTVPNLYLWDRTTGAEQAITNGNDASGGSRNWLRYELDTVGAPISDDGRYVTFSSDATDLVDGPSPGPGLFQWDRVTGETTQIATDSWRIEADAVSSDGRTVTFSVWTSGPAQVRQWDRTTGTTRVVAQGNADIDVRWVSPDGSRVVLESTATDMVPGLDDGETHPYLWERAGDGGTLQQFGPDFATALDWDDDVQKVVFTTDRTELGGTTAQSKAFLFLWDRSTGASQQLNEPSFNARLDEASLSDDGSTVTWVSDSTTDVAGVPPSGQHPGRTAFQWRAATDERTALTAPNADLGLDAVSPDGDLAVVRTSSTTLVGDPHGLDPMGYLWERDRVPTVPAAPWPDGTPTGSGTRAWVHWQPPVPNGAPARTSYEITPVHEGGELPPTVVGAAATFAAVTGLTAGVTYRFRIAARNANGPGPAILTEPITITGVRGPVFVPMHPCRILDTRQGAGSPVGTEAEQRVQVSGIIGCEIPDDATAVEATVTAVSPTGSGFLRAWPAGAAAPTATFLNYPAKQSTTNTGALAVEPAEGLPEGRTGLALRAFANPTHVVIDVQGYFAPAPDDETGTLFVPLEPCRAYDSRQGDGPLPTTGARTIPITGRPACSVPSNALAVEATVTAVAPKGSGFLRAWPAGTTAPTATLLNYPGKQSASNTGTLAVDGPTAGSISVRAFANATDLVVDIQGYFVPAGPTVQGAMFRPMVPCRILDTRFHDAQPLGPSDQLDVAVSGVGGCGIPHGALAIEGTVTAVSPSAGGYLRTAPGDGALTTTVLNYGTNGSVTNTGATVVYFGPPSATIPELRLKNYGGRTHVVIDVQGYYIEQ